ncbi:MAG: phage baseplate assembly protein [Myxococcales bacterium]|nr:phage baseplate assembly protein [Myxococcales bacterium]
MSRRGLNHDAADYARATDPRDRSIRGALRRVVVDLTTKAAWRVLGYLVDGDQESFRAEVFSGIGFWARPPADGRPEAIVANVGGYEHPVIIATRDQKTRAAIAELEADETAIFTSTATVVIKADGTVEVRSATGTAVPLALLSDLAALKSAIEGWTPAPNDGGAALQTALTALFTSWPVGTTVLKGE